MIVKISFVSGNNPKDPCFRKLCAPGMKCVVEGCNGVCKPGKWLHYLF